MRIAAWVSESAGCIGCALTPWLANVDEQDGNGEAEQATAAIPTAKPIMFQRHKGDIWCDILLLTGFRRF